MKSKGLYNIIIKLINLICKRYKAIIILISVLIAFYVLVYQYPLNEEAIIVKSKILALTNLNENKLLNIKQMSNNRIFVKTDDNIQEIINNGIGKRVIFTPGIYNIDLLNIPSNIVIEIPENVLIKLGDDIVIDQSNYKEAQGDAVFSSKGLNDNYKTNIHIILNGIIDGNKDKHPYIKGGIEGISWQWVRDSSITGNGTIKNCNGDGIDIDCVINSIFYGINIENNNGSGFHLGSPRPIDTNYNNYCVYVHTRNNGFYHNRSGFDHTWPNIDGITYISCESTDNNYNWNIEGWNCVLIDCNLKYEYNINNYTRVINNYTSDITIKANGEYLILIKNMTNNIQNIIMDKTMLKLYNIGNIKNQKPFLVSIMTLTKGKLLYDESNNKNYDIKLYKLQNLESIKPIGYYLNIQKFHFTNFIKKIYYSIGGFIKEIV